MFVHLSVHLSIMAHPAHPESSYLSVMVGGASPWKNYQRDKQLPTDNHPQIQTILSLHFVSCACLGRPVGTEHPPVGTEPAALQLTIMTLVDAVSNKIGMALCSFAKMLCCDNWAHFKVQKSKSPPNPCLTEVFIYMLSFLVCLLISAPGCH